jgi:hypothetical protein
MTEAQPSEPTSSEEPREDPSFEVADTQAPARLGERGVDLALERELDKGGADSAA